MLRLGSERKKKKKKRAKDILLHWEDVRYERSLQNSKNK